MFWHSTGEMGENIFVITDNKCVYMGTASLSFVGIKKTFLVDKSTRETLPTGHQSRASFKKQTFSFCNDIYRYFAIPLPPLEIPVGGITEHIKNCTPFRMTTWIHL